MIGMSSAKLSELGARIRIRRVALRLTQQDAAQHSGVSYSTWRRMEAEGRASIEDLVRASHVLRCEEGLDVLFPEPAASSMDELLQQQRDAAKRGRQRAPRSRW